MARLCWRFGDGQPDRIQRTVKLPGDKDFRMALDWLRMLYDYNYWAHRRMLDSMEAMTEAQLTGQMGSSWGSPKGLIVHMLGAEWIWRQRWVGISPTSLLNPDDFAGLGAVRARWDEDEREMRAFLSGLQEADLDREILYTNTKGIAGKGLLSELMFHLLNHSNHHRGELAAMLALLDVPHPEDELLIYLREGHGIGEHRVN